jgi:hypothetical protein
MCRAPNRQALNYFFAGMCLRRWAAGQYRGGANTDAAISAQTRNRRLQGIKAIVERQQGMPAEGDNDRFLLDGKRGGLCLAWSSPQIGDRSGLAPLGDGLGVHPMTAGKVRQARLTMLDYATNCFSRGGTPVENLANSASFHSCEKTALSKPGSNILTLPHTVLHDPPPSVGTVKHSPYEICPTRLPGGFKSSVPFTKPPLTCEG